MKLPMLTQTLGAQNKLIWGLVASNLFLAVSLFSSLQVNFSTHDDTVLVPPYLSRSVKVGWSSADQEYLKSIGLYVATLSTSVTPKDVTFVTDALSQIIHPSIYPSTRQQILALANDPIFVSTGASTTFEPLQSIYEADTQKVFVTGTLTTKNMTSKKSVAEVVEMRIVMINGRPWVMAMDHYPGNQPKTLEWIQKNTDQNAPKKPASSPVDAMQSGANPQPTDQTSTEVAQ